MIKCLVIAAAICLNGNATIKSESTGSWRGADIMLESGSVTAVLVTDDQSEPDRAKMHKICVKGACLYYFGTCLSDAGALTCQLFYNDIADPVNRQIILKSTSATAMRSLDQSLSIAEGGQLFPLSIFSFGDVGYPPICRAINRSFRTSRAAPRIKSSCPAARPEN